MSNTSDKYIAALVMSLSCVSCVSTPDVLISDLKLERVLLLEDHDVKFLPPHMRKQFSILANDRVPMVEIVLATELDLIFETHEARPMTLGVRFNFCEKEFRPGLFAHSEVISEGVQVGEWSTPDIERGRVALLTGKQRSQLPHAYSVYLRVRQSERVSMRPAEPPHPAYDLYARPQDVCLKFIGVGEAVRLESNVVTVPSIVFQELWDSRRGVASE